MDENNSAKEFDIMPEQLFYSTPSFAMVPGLALRNYPIIVKSVTFSDAARVYIFIYLHLFCS